MCMNYSVNVDVQVHWCEAQKHQLFQIEIFFFSFFLESWRLFHIGRLSQVCIYVIWEKGKGQTASSFMLVEANMSHIGYVGNVLEVSGRVNRRVRY